MVFNHLDREGHPVMVDIEGKTPSRREATAEGWIYLPRSVFDAIESNAVAKGDVLQIAELAGIQGAKRTAELIPLCHPLRLDAVAVRCEMDQEKQAIHIIATAKAREATGVEMEALTSVSLAALTVYDMCKGIDKGMRIEGIRLLRKSGGKSGFFECEVER